MKTSSYSFFIFLVQCFHECYPHVSLKYPPARMLDLDFLDSFRTPGDCGMEEGTVRTSLKAGSTFNLTWHLGYAHGGGYRLELVNPAEDLSLLLLPVGGGENSWETGVGKFAQSHAVQLPQGVECENCYLQFQRQALEWGKKYKFRSCADIKVVGGGEVVEECSGKGRVEGGVCVCDRGREGTLCQYETQCQDDQDCNGPKGQGKCLEVDNTLYPMRQCFCSVGWYGSQCENRARWEGADVKKYVKEDFTEEKMGDVSLLWRTDGDEVEMIVSAPTTSWLGLGWRPSSATKSCQKFPEQYTQYRPADFHAMDCMDMVIGVARGNLGRVGDFYTRDRSTPREDSFWGGDDDLVSSSAWEEDGKTTLRFIKKMFAGTADHDLEGKLTLIWAYGQEDGFYKSDLLKYHGRKSRGVASLEIVSQGYSLSLSGLTPISLGILVSCILLVLLLLLQVFQNFNKKLNCCTPSYQSFSPEH